MTRQLIAGVPILFLLLIFAAVPLAGAAQGDHPLVSRYSGATLKDKKVEAFAEYNLVTGLTPEKKDFIGQTVQGKVTRIVYQNPTGRSTLEIFTNYREALSAAGVTTLFVCGSTIAARRSRAVLGAATTDYLLPPTATPVISPVKSRRPGPRPTLRSWSVASAANSTLLRSSPCKAIRL